MVIDDRQHLVVAPVRQLGVDFVSIDEADEVDTPDLSDGLDLPELEAEKLHEGAVLAVAHLVAVADCRLGYAEALPEVRLRERARDSVGIGVASKRDEDVLASRQRKRLPESVCP